VKSISLQLVLEILEVIDMSINETDLDQLASEANYVLDSAEPLTEVVVKGTNDFWYRRNGVQEIKSVHILAYGHSKDTENAKLFYRTSKEFDKGVDLNNGKPSYTGDEVVKLLMQQVTKIKQNKPK